MYCGLSFSLYPVRVSLFGQAAAAPALDTEHVALAFVVLMWIQTKWYLVLMYC